MPLFSIILASLNSAGEIERCLKSIIEQRYVNFEIIVIDGESTDGTTQIISAYSDHIAFWESKPDAGIYHAWNKALMHVKGDWIIFIGADDFLWNDVVLSNLSPFLSRAEHLNIPAVYGKVAEINHNGELLKQLGKPWKKIKWQLPHGMPRHLPHPGLMHHASLFKKYGLFDENFKIAGDYEFLLRALKNDSALFADNIIVTGHQTGGISNKYKLNTQLEVAKAKKKNGYGKLSWLWVFVFIRTLFRALYEKIIH